MTPKEVSALYPFEIKTVHYSSDEILPWNTDGNYRCFWGNKECYNVPTKFVLAHTFGNKYCFTCYCDKCFPEFITSEWAKSTADCYQIITRAEFFEIHKSVLKLKICEQIKEYPTHLTEKAFKEILAEKALEI